MALVKENADLRNREAKHIDTVKQLKTQLDQEHKQLRQMRAEKVNFLSQRNELEEFFLQCIEEVRKEIVKRRSISSAYKTMKRSTSQSSMRKQQQQSNQVPNPKLEQYTSTDKKKVIELLMSNENVLLFLYEKLFPAASISTQSQSRASHIGGGGMQAGKFTMD